MKERRNSVSAKEKREAAIETIREAARRWPTSFIPRTEVPSFTGHLYSVGYLANCDCRGDGVDGAFWIGRQRVYPVDKLVEWLIKRLVV